MQTRFLDYSNEVSEIRDPPSGRLVWLGDDLSGSDWLIDITDDALNEITSLAAFIQDNPLPMLQRRVNDVAIPACQRLMSMMKSILDDGVGFAVLDRLPVDEYPVETLVDIYWILGNVSVAR